MLCADDVCGKPVVPGSKWCEDHMPESEARERLAGFVEKLKEKEASFDQILEAEKSGEEQIALARLKQDFEKTAPKEAEEKRLKAGAKFEQATIQGELKEMAFADYVQGPDCPRVQIFLEARYLNWGLDGQCYLLLNGVDWPVKPDTVNEVPEPFAQDYKSKMGAWAYLQKVERALSAETPREMKSDAEYERLLTKASKGDL